MGFLRFFLAYVVLLAHCPEGLLPKIFHSSLAVQCFFTISGFYMQLLVSEKYKNQNPKQFYKNFYLSRIFRIFPIYLLTLLITFLFLDKGPIDTILLAEDIKALIVYITSNLLIDFSIGEYLFYGSMNVSDFLHANNFNILIQSWSLDLEIIFYILTPFILTVRKNSIIFLLIFLCITLRFILASNNYNYSFSHFWTHAFFPTELATFLLGSLSYRFYAYSKKNNLKEKKLYYFNDNYSISLKNYNFILFSLIISITIIFLLLFGNPLNSNNYNFFGGDWDKGLYGVPNSYWIVILLNALIIPFLFDFFKNSRIDSFIGHLSYPMYICHFSVIIFLNKLNIENYYLSIFTFLLTLLISIILVLCIEKPITKYRHDKFYKS